MTSVIENEDLQDALDGMGIHEVSIVNTFGNLSKDVMQNVFGDSSGVEDFNGLKPIFNYDHQNNLEARFLVFKNALVMYSQHPFERDARLLHVALNDLENFHQKKVVVELMCTRTLPEIVGFSMAYDAIFRTNFKEDLKAITPKTLDLQVLLGVCELPYKGKMDLEHWRRNGDFCGIVGAGKAEDVLKKMTDDRITSINSWMKNNIDFPFDDVKTNKMFEIVQQCIEDPVGYFTKVLEDSFSSRSADTLTRVIVTRNSIDLALIDGEFTKRGKKSLCERIGNTCLGDYKDFLLTLVPASAALITPKTTKTPKKKRGSFFPFR
ncbi:unnamed protein product [Lactuca saligna]|uniref:Uncharacterized protein n=1 Tax=Lactuca saligna TaxID=75948 RepID=A0AA36EMP1_LACSI|nr:unnamed protein product [Lactuca saligna]